MNAPAPVLYAEGGVRVTPSWVGVDDVSHAVKNVVRLRRVEHLRARGSWHALFWTLLCLAVASVYVAVRGDVAFALAWGAFAGSIVLALVAAWHAFVAPDAFGVEIGLADGTRLEAPATDRGQLERLHDALAHALDWHGGTPVGGQVGGQVGEQGREQGGGSVPGFAPVPPGRYAPSGWSGRPGTFDREDPSGDDVVRVVDEHGRVVGEDPFPVDASALHRRR